MEIDTSKDKNVVLVGKCGKCKKEFTAEAELPTLRVWDGEGNSYVDVALPHLVSLCPYCFGLLNLAKRFETNKKPQKEKLAKVWPNGRLF